MWVLEFQLYNKMYYCWHVDPGQRPSFSKLVKEFEKMVGENVDYIHLDKFPDHDYYVFNANADSRELL